MDRFPAEFRELLSPAGRRVLDGKLALRAEPFLARSDLLAPGKAKAAFALLERALGPVVKPMERTIPPESILNQTRNYQERLPKTVRVRTADLDASRGKAREAARATGLAAMLLSPSFCDFAEALAGRKLMRGFGRQALRYGPGDYSGPHTDHHPEDPVAKDGYFDLHLSFVGGGATRQLLVYAKDGHLSETVDVAVPGLVSAYRLPFWHYTTPLEGKSSAARWLILGTFYFA